MASQRETGGRSQGAIGQPIVRREDRRLLTGGDPFTDDLDEPEVVHATILRSPYAHAQIESCRVAAAEEMAGVLEVFTGTTFARSGFPGTVPSWFEPPDSTDGPFRVRRDLVQPPRPAIASEVVRHVGEPVAVVVAEEPSVAHDALDRIEVSYERLEAVTDSVEAVQDGAPQLHEEAPKNIAIDWEVGDTEGVDRAFAEAPHNVRLRLSNQRLIPNAMEPRSILANFDENSGMLSVTSATQTPHHDRRLISESLSIPEQDIRVHAPAVGGGFGTKSKSYPAEVIVPWCSMQVGRPVSWTATRPESYLTGIHGRAHETEAALALDDEGHFLGLKVETHANVGAYLSKATPRIVTEVYACMLSGPYTIPAIHGRVIAAFTNTAPVDAYRGAGRPQAAYVLERLVDVAARRLDVDPVELRRRNLISSDQLPYQTPVGPVYEAGDFRSVMERALDLVDDDLLDYRGDHRADDRYLGIGLANFIEETGVPAPEGAKVRVDASGTVTAAVGTADHGQGHETTFAQVVAHELGVSINDVVVESGDSDLVPEGTGSFASRSTLAGGNALVAASQELIELGRERAASTLEAREDDLEYDAGEFRVVGSPGRSVSLQDLARGAPAEDSLAAALEHTPNVTHAFGTHVAVVEVDAATGEIEIKQFVAVHDCGAQINPMIVEGQVHGGVAQGIGQALYEEAIYDDAGSLLTGSLQDYVVPKAAQLPDLTVEFSQTPAASNSLGVKGVGENGTLGPPPAIVNAVVNALAPLGVEHLEMPLTPASVWEAINQ